MAMPIPSRSARRHDARGPSRASPSRPSARTARRPKSCRSRPRIAGWPRRTSACTWAASRPRSRTISRTRRRTSSSSRRSLPREHILAELDRLAESCDPGTKVVVIGHVNDVVLYRELLKRGVSEYLVAPIAPLQLMESISNLYNNPDTEPVGHVYAFIGAKGGVGSSTVCHNAAWALSEILKSERRHRRSRSRLRHHRPRLQSGPGAGHRRRAGEP